MSFQKLIIFPYLHLIGEYLKNDRLCYCNKYTNDVIEFMLVNKNIYDYFKNNFWNKYPKIIIQPVLCLKDVMPGYTYPYLTNRKICSCMFESKIFDEFSRAFRCLKAHSNYDNDGDFHNMKRINNIEPFIIDNNKYIEETLHFNKPNILLIRNMIHCYFKNIIVTESTCCNNTGLLLLFKIY